MAGTLTISTLSDGTNSTSSTNCIQGSAKAWVNYKGTATRGINASYNVSSVTFNGTGDYTINFTNALADANYSFAASSSNSAQGVSDEYSGISAYGTNSYLAGSLRIVVLRWRFDVQQLWDVPIVSVAIFR